LPPTVTPADWRIERFDPDTHDRAGFDCGKAPLSEWLVRYAGQHERRGLARVYVLVRPGSRKVLGYYALASHAVEYQVLPAGQAKGLPPRADVPAVLLARLAVDRSVHRQRLGKLLLIHALQRVQYVSTQIGVRVVEVDAIDDEARNFYLKYHFVPLADDPRHLFLTLDEIRKLGLSPLAGPSP
jgi:GNAT superfamily N-acetyltransferase